ncbi:unnamed protein product [Prorocentrum cordatum]|uniref:Uncharacterized protein n=1 Tax=Prorocentrum cordatum TaxID=2364126 RepID=A0ABN9WE76_9DINO|nr:unnamed protein product [Polarella glacialis]
MASAPAKFVNDVAEDLLHLWWSPEDFESFLGEQVEIATAYSEAVERGEEALFRTDPVLANNSRRGLGLGRGPTRASNSQAYFTAVMDEQDRQRRLGESWTSRPCPAWRRRPAWQRCNTPWRTPRGTPRTPRSTWQKLRACWRTWTRRRRTTQRRFSMISRRQGLRRRRQARGGRRRLPKRRSPRRRAESGAVLPRFQSRPMVRTPTAAPSGSAFPALMCPHKTDSTVGDGLLRPVILWHCSVKEAELKVERLGFEVAGRLRVDMGAERFGVTLITKPLVMMYLECSLRPQLWGGRTR